MGSGHPNKVKMIHLFLIIAQNHLLSNRKFWNVLMDNWKVLVIVLIQVYQDLLGNRFQNRKEQTKEKEKRIMSRKKNPFFQDLLQDLLGKIIRCVKTRCHHKGKRIAILRIVMGQHHLLTMILRIVMGQHHLLTMILKNM